MHRGVGAARVSTLLSECLASADEADTSSVGESHACIGELRGFCLGWILRWEVRPGWYMSCLAFKRSEG